MGSRGWEGRVIQKSQAVWWAVPQTGQKCQPVTVQDEREIRDGAGGTHKENHSGALGCCPAYRPLPWALSPPLPASMSPPPHLLVSSLHTPLPVRLPSSRSWVRLGSFPLQSIPFLPPRCCSLLLAPSLRDGAKLKWDLPRGLLGPPFQRQSLSIILYAISLRNHCVYLWLYLIVSASSVRPGANLI